MKKLNWIFGILSLVVLIAAPHFFKTYGVYLLTYWLVYVIANLGLNLIVGYAGLKALGHRIAYSMQLRLGITPFTEFRPVPTE